MNKILLYLNYITMMLSRIIPKKKNRWVFGAWFGDKISDNSLAFYQYIKENHHDIEAVWICNNTDDAEKKGLNAVKKNTFKSVWKCLTARVVVMNQGYKDFGEYNWISGSFKVQLWHGVPWKKIGEDKKDEKTGILHWLSHKTFLITSKCDLYIAPSETTRKAIASAFLAQESSIVLVGQPRNELLLNNDRCEHIRDLLENSIGKHKKYVIYMPTFRDKSDEQFSFIDCYDRFASLFQEYDVVILEKQHYVSTLRNSKEDKTSDRIIDVNAYDTQELLAFADVLITDYSSCYFDYLLRDKPIIHYLYDYEKYKNDDRGLYYDIDEAVGGAVAYTIDDLANELTSVISGNDLYTERRSLIRDKFDKYESPGNSEIIAAEIFKRIQ